MDLVHKISFIKAKPASYWVNSANQNLPQFSSVILVIMLAWYLSQFVWILLPQQDEFDWSIKVPVVAGATGQMSASGQTDFGGISAAHLFGIPGAEPVITATVDAPETRLDLKLRGTVAADDPAMAHAIIADGKGKDNVYFIKDKVPGGAVLHEVHADRVILNRAGALETLRLPKLSKALGQKGSSPVKASNPRRSGGFAGGRPSTSNQPSSSFTDILRPQPFMPNGELKGYRIYPGRDRRKFAALGFRPGDLVTEVNGQALNNLQSGMEVFKEIGSASQITVTIERAGQPMVVTVDSSQMNTDSGGQQ
jgi:general secretion pathway protein C